MLNGLLDGVFDSFLATCAITGLCDTDGDRVPDAFDNCPGWPNPSQECCDPVKFGFACTMPSAFRTYWVGQLQCSADPTDPRFACAFGQPIGAPTTLDGCTVMRFSGGTLATRDLIYGPVAQVSGPGACLSSFVQPPPPITLVVRSATRPNFQQFSPYMFVGEVGAGLQLTATITNVSNSAVSVSKYSPIVINVGGILVMPLRPVGFSEGPLPVTFLTPAEMALTFDNDPNEIAANQLVTLAPQQSVDFSVEVVRSTNWTVGQEPSAKIYSPPGPAFYSMAFNYAYAGPDSNPQATFPNVYRGKVTSPPVIVGVQ
jgi:hypothetical protein